MLHILIRSIIATLVSIGAILFSHAAMARETLAEMAAGLSIDETLEREGVATDYKEKLATDIRKGTEKQEKKAPRPYTPLMQKKHIPGTAAPAPRLPLYMYRSFGNNYNDKEAPAAKPAAPARVPAPVAPQKAPVKPVAPTGAQNKPSPAELAVTKEYEEIKALEPASGGESSVQAKPLTPAAQQQSAEKPEQPTPAVATKPDEKEKAMRKTIEDIKAKKAEQEKNAPKVDEKEQAMRKTIEAIDGKKPEPEPEPQPEVKSYQQPSHVTRIGSVPSMEKEVDYVSILEKSMLLDPQPLPVKQPFYDEAGNEVNLRQFKGKLILLNFWATWCTPCAMEMPSLDALQEDFDDRELPIKVLALSEDFKGPEAIREFYTQNKIVNLEIYQDKHNNFFRELGVISLPTTMLIDQNGQEILRMSGYIDWNKQDVRDFVRSFLRE